MALRDDIDWAIRDRMADTAGMLELWPTALMGRDETTVPTDEKLAFVIRWCEAMHGQLLRLADEIDALRPPANAG